MEIKQHALNKKWRNLKGNLTIPWENENENTPNILLKREKFKFFPPRSGIRHRHSYLPLLFNILLKLQVEHLHNTNK